MKVRLTMGVLILALVAGMSLAQQSSVSAQEPEETATTTPTVTREAAEDEAADADDSDDGNFLPTEKINVDSSVSFPVDI